MKSGVAQVGFAALPIEGVIAEEIARDEWLALVPKRQFREKTSITLSELAVTQFLMSEEAVNAIFNESLLWLALLPTDR